MSPLLPLAEKGPGVEDTSRITPDFNIELILVIAKQFPIDFLCWPCDVDGAMIEHMH